MIMSLNTGLLRRKLLAMTNKILIFVVLIGLSPTSFALSLFTQPQPAAPPTDQQLIRRIFMLEYALAPHSPQEVATTWAEAVKNRNGAVQYMLLCPALQKKYQGQMEALNWVSGTSSPRVTSYKITNIDNKFTISYTFSIDIGTNKDILKIQPVKPQANSSQQWCINSLVSY